MLHLILTCLPHWWDKQLTQKGEINSVAEQRITLIPLFPLHFSFLPPSLFYLYSLERKKLGRLCFLFSLIFVKDSLDTGVFSGKCKLCPPSPSLHPLFPVDRQLVELDFPGVVWPSHISHFS